MIQAWTSSQKRTSDAFNNIIFFWYNIWVEDLKMELKKDDAVLFKFSKYSEWKKGHFAKKENGIYYVYPNGKTSWTNDIPNNFARCYDIKKGE